MSERMPAIFFGHGSPMIAIEPNRFTAAWDRLGKALPRPRAILAVSAHWYTRGTGVTAMEKPRTIHDFGGFPKALYEIRYPAPGSLELAARARELARPVSVGMDNQWGFDHGTWTVLMHVFPKADIPIVQLSIDGTQPARFHYDLGRRLAPLRDEGVLIVGSGNVVHNLYVMQRDATRAYDWAARFETKVKDLVVAGDHDPLIDYATLGADAEQSIPTPDHYLPLLYVLGGQDDRDSISFPTDGIDLASVSMLSVAVGLPVGLQQTASAL